MIHLFTKILHSCLLSHFSHVPFFVTLWTIASQAPLAIGFSRQEYGSGLSCPLPEDLPDTATETQSYIFCVGRWILYHQHTREMPYQDSTLLLFVIILFLMFKGKTVSFYSAVQLISSWLKKKKCENGILNQIVVPNQK